MLAPILLALAQIQTDTLLVDILPLPELPPVSSDPVAVGDFGDGRILFRAAMAPLLRPWVTDGTAAGSVPLFDATDPATNFRLEAFQDLEPAVLPGGRLVVDLALVGPGAPRLHVTDGTLAGTQALLPAGLQAYSLTAHQGEVWFLIGSGSSARLWRTDGTPAGTQPAFELDDLFPDAGGWELAATSADLILGCNNSNGPFIDYEVRMFSSDGTLGGSTELLLVDAASSFEFTDPFADRLGVRISGVVSQPQFGLWSVDGTPAGTEKLLPGTSYAWTEVSGDRLFAAMRKFDPDQSEVFVTDGTAAGTSLLGEFGPAPFSFGGSAAEFAGGVAFAAQRAASGLELWFTDGTVAGTGLIEDLVQGPGGSEPSRITVSNGLLYLTARLPGFGRELWTVADPALGMSPVVDAAPGGASSQFMGPDSFFGTSAGLVYGVFNAGAGFEPHVSDGTAAGTGVLLNIAVEPGQGSGIAEFVEYRGLSYFVAESPEHGVELWRTDGTQAGTELAFDGIPGPASSSPRQLAVFKDRLLFHISSDATGSIRELAMSDGTAGGTQLLTDFSAVSGAGPIEIFAGDELAFFTANEPVGGTGVWRTDGTALGTYPVSGGIQFQGFVDAWAVAGDRLLFTGRELVGGVVTMGNELYLSDGTAAGTGLIADLSPGVIGTIVRDATSLGSAFLISLNRQDGTGVEPWVSDGTAAGTLPLADLYPGPGWSDPRWLVEVDGKMLFTGVRSGAERELFATDGTPGALEELLPFSGGVGVSLPSGDALLADYSSGSGDAQVLRTDGTAVGTQVVFEWNVNPADNPGAGTSEIFLGAVGNAGRFAFVDDGPSGSELWIGDSQTGASFQVADSAPGVLSGRPSRPRRAGDALVFLADDGLTGQEPHAIPFGVTGTPAVASIGAACSGVGADYALSLGVPLGVGQATTVELSRAAPATLGFVFRGTGVPLQPEALGCAIYLENPAYLGALAIDGAGSASLGVAVPATPALAGLRVVLQAVVVEAGGPLLGAFGTSNGLDAVVGP